MRLPVSLSRLLKCFIGFVISCVILYVFIDELYGLYLLADHGKIVNGTVVDELGKTNMLLYQGTTESRHGERRKYAFRHIVRYDGNVQAMNLPEIHPLGSTLPVVYLPEMPHIVRAVRRQPVTFLSLVWHRYDLVMACLVLYFSIGMFWGTAAELTRHLYAIRYETR